MDFVTHSLVGAGIARVMNPRRPWLPQTTLAGMLGSLLMDSDSWLALLGPNVYGLFHRKISHCIVALVVWIVLSAAIVRAVSRVKNWRRFGWFCAENLPSGKIPDRAPWLLLISIATIAAAFHWLGDAITGFGNLMPLYPWNQWEVNFRLVLSFDWFIFSATLAWQLGSRYFNWTRTKEILVAGCWLVAVIVYLGIRRQFCDPTVW